MTNTGRLSRGLASVPQGIAAYNFMPRGTGLESNRGGGFQPSGRYPHNRSSAPGTAHGAAYEPPLAHLAMKGVKVCARHSSASMPTVNLAFYLYANV